MQDIIQIIKNILGINGSITETLPIIAGVIAGIIWYKVIKQLIEIYKK